jgi:hypothetical protein
LKNKNNKGQYYSRYKGVLSAKGKYLIINWCRWFIIKWYIN